MFELHSRQSTGSIIKRFKYKFFCWIVPISVIKYYKWLNYPYLPTEFQYV